MLGLLVPARLSGDPVKPCGFSQGLPKAPKPQNPMVSLRNELIRQELELKLLGKEDYRKLRLIGLGFQVGTQVVCERAVGQTLALRASLSQLLSSTE